MTEFRKVALSTGVTLNVALAGDPQDPAVILLHGFPESHRTWREVAPRLQDEFFLVMPDQRGFAGSDLPQDVEDYQDRPADRRHFRARRRARHRTVRAGRPRLGRRDRLGRRRCAAIRD